MTVFLWGREDDPVLGIVRDRLHGTAVKTITSDGGDISRFDRNRVVVNDVLCDLAEITGILVRPPGSGDARMYGALAAWAETSPVAVLNRLSAGASNRSKPHQLYILDQVGFNVPDTIVTNDPADVRAFAVLHEAVIYKSVSGIRSIVNVLDIRDDARLARVEACPTQFQQYVGGVDYRVHVVGDEQFATSIRTTALDYRYASTIGKETVMEPATLPETVADLCRAATKRLGLSLAGIDLRLDADGRWWCFEVNTAPGFIWFEQQTGQPIAASVARLLSGESKVG